MTGRGYTAGNSCVVGLGATAEEAAADLARRLKLRAELTREWLQREQRAYERRRAERVAAALIEHERQAADG